MTAADLILDLRKHPVELFVVDGRLKFRGPKEAITPEVKGLLSEHKAELIKLLSLDDRERSIEDLEVRIREALEGRELPILLGKGTRITGIEGYAKTESRDAYHKSPWVRGNARERLARLGVAV